MAVGFGPKQNNIKSECEGRRGTVPPPIAALNLTRISFNIFLFPSTSLRHPYSLIILLMTNLTCQTSALIPEMANQQATPNAPVRTTITIPPLPLPLAALETSKPKSKPLAPVPVQPPKSSRLRKHRLLQLLARLPHHHREQVLVEHRNRPMLLAPGSKR